MSVSKSPLAHRLMSTPAGKRLWNQERFILEITELVCELMEEDRVTRSDLAARLGKTKGYITQLLDGTANMQIRTIADVFTVLDYLPHIHATRTRDEDAEQAASLSGELSLDISPSGDDLSKIAFQAT